MAEHVTGPSLYTDRAAREMGRACNQAESSCIALAIHGIK